MAGCAAKAPAPVAPAPVPIPAPPPRPSAPPAFDGLSSDALKTRLGTPAFSRKDGTTEMWRYDGASCRAFFFLYGAPPVVRHVETLPHGSGSAADMACLSALKSSSPKTS